eukprot:5177891-Prymnesium_polylepis.1
MAALHWRMALLVRSWRTRRARRWELNELGPYEYAANPMVARLWETAGCQAVAPSSVLIGVEGTSGDVGWE